jgi:predicted CoA-substrate-specific enzyme activase
MEVYVGFDIGSTFTKIVVLGEEGEMVSLRSFPSPAAQKAVFSEIGKHAWQGNIILARGSCGYGRKNIEAEAVIPELVALGKGIFQVLPQAHTVLDIGSQDAKVIRCHHGKITRFLLNDTCAAGSGLMLQNTLGILNINFEMLRAGTGPIEGLSRVCEVFVQTELIRLIAQGKPPEQLMDSVLFSILKQACILLRQIQTETLFAFTGGLSLIPGMGDLLSSLVKVDVAIPAHSSYLAALGCVAAVKHAS